MQIVEFSMKIRQICFFKEFFLKFFNLFLKSVTGHTEYLRGEPWIGHHWSIRMHVTIGAQTRARLIFYIILNHSNFQGELHNFHTAVVDSFTLLITD